MVLTARAEFWAGLSALVVWAIIQFGVAPPSGWIHLLLGTGVVLVIRGLARKG